MSVHEQIEREVEMDKFFRRGKYSTNVNPATGEFIESPPSADKPHRCHVIKRLCPKMTMNTDMAIITQDVKLAYQGKQFWHTVELATCKREDVAREYQKHAQAWRLEEESK